MNIRSILIDYHSLIDLKAFKRAVLA